MKPILFSTPMVTAILNGAKTQTRRICKQFKMPIEVVHQDTDGGFIGWSNENTTKEASDKLYPNGGGVKCPYGNVGDILWVRETFRFVDNGFKEWYEYKASPETITTANEKWKPSIFMPKEACRVQLKITNVRCERLNNISENDAAKEGVELFTYLAYRPKNEWVDYSGENPFFSSAKESYKSLWDKINGVNSWDENPFVWVIEFEAIKP